MKKKSMNLLALLVRLNRFGNIVWFQVKMITSEVLSINYYWYYFNSMSTILYKNTRKCKVNFSKNFNTYFTQEI